LKPLLQLLKVFLFIKPSANIFRKLTANSLKFGQIALIAFLANVEGHLAQAQLLLCFGNGGGNFDAQFNDAIVCPRDASAPARFADGTALLHCSLRKV
jgi:hypothetical protein